MQKLALHFSPNFPKYYLQSSLTDSLPVHDGLKNGREGSDSNTSSDEDGVLRVEYLGRGGAERSVDVHVQGFVHLHQQDNEDHVFRSGSSSIIHFCDTVCTHVFSYLLT